MSTRERKSPVWVYRRSKEDDEIKLETWKMVNRKKSTTLGQGIFRAAQKSHKRQFDRPFHQDGLSGRCVLAHLSLFSETKER